MMDSMTHDVAYVIEYGMVHCMVHVKVYGNHMIYSTGSCIYHWLHANRICSKYANLGQSLAIQECKTRQSKAI